MNKLRIKKKAELDSKMNKIEKRQAKAARRSSKRKSIRREKGAEMKDLYRTRRARTIRMAEIKLKTGDTHEGKLRWVKIQRYDL